MVCHLKVSNLQDFDMIPKHFASCETRSLNDGKILEKPKFSYQETKTRTKTILRQ